MENCREERSGAHGPAVKLPREETADFLQRRVSKAGGSRDPGKGKV